MEDKGWAGSRWSWKVAFACGIAQSGQSHSGIRAGASAGLKHGAPAPTLRRLKLVTFTKVEKVGDTYEDVFYELR